MLGLRAALKNGSQETMLLSNHRFMENQPTLKGPRVLTRIVQG